MQTLLTLKTARRLARLARGLSSSTVPPATTKFLLSYDYVDGILEKRAPFRKEHVAAAQREVAAGRLEQAGALSAPVDGAVFVFTTEDAEPVERFVRNDPYYLNGLVPAYNIREWTVVVEAP